MKKVFLLMIGMVLALGLSVFAFNEADNSQRCTMDVQCGNNKKCVNGVCTGGTNPQIHGRCVNGNFGKKVCSNTGAECSNDSQCWK